MKLLSENIKNMTRGVQPLVDPIEDTNLKKGIAGNSWFWVGHFEAEGHKLNFMYHVSVLQFSKFIPLRMVNSVLSITDETTSEYYHEDRFFRAKKDQISDTGLNLAFDKDYVSGSLDNMHIKASMPNGSIDVKMQAVGYPLYNVGTGYFQIWGVCNYQYSIPTLVSKGTITLNGKTYEVEGNTWFDRQFADMPKGRSLKDGYNCHWIWMDLNFDNDEDKISLWGSVENSTGKEYAWATVLHPDGSQEVVEVENMTQYATDIWVSPKTGQRYPTKWIVKIPSLDAELEVTSSLKEQEIISGDPAGMKYEGASSFVGTYKGKKTSGYCCLELVGAWK